MSKRHNILFQFTGSIACYKACSAVSRLVADRHAVRTICSANALKFIGKATLEGLTHEPVLTDTFEEKRALEHIELGKWADLAIVCPATANIINKLAAGVADDYISTAFLAWDLKKPYLVAPAMNRNMYLHPATQEGIRKLSGWGVKVLPAGEGRQACGDEGPGRLPEPEQIVEAIYGGLK